jgi:hypothetical protein
MRVLSIRVASMRATRAVMSHKPSGYEHKDTRALITKIIKIVPLPVIEAAVQVAKIARPRHVLLQGALQHRRVACLKAEKNRGGRGKQGWKESRGEQTRGIAVKRRECSKEKGGTLHLASVYCKFSAMITSFSS